ncbi:hypothetical protein QF022_002182 [Vogesella perlucida]|nr:hypothetical protein [Vogesella perlucida]
MNITGLRVCAVFVAIDLIMEIKMLNPVVAHLEHYLGPISCGWSDEESILPFKVVSFENQPADKVITYSTLGLSEVVLGLPRGRKVRQELVISAHASTPANEIANFLLSCVEFLNERGDAILRGEVVNSPSLLIKGATVNAVYATNPTPFGIGFSELSGAVPPVIFVLLVPITTNEELLIRSEGWSWFEDMLETQDPDIWNFYRSEQVLKW